VKLAMSLLFILKLNEAAKYSLSFLSKKKETRTFTINHDGIRNFTIVYAEILTITFVEI
jgi:hypothetical protein